MVTLEESIPQVSTGYQQARSAFFTQFNDVDFYVEDAWQENLYHCILSNLFPKLKIENIHPLGGKPHLLEHASSPIPGRKSVYLLDKDFDDLLGLIRKQENVFYLDCYSIENYLFEERAVVEFVVAEKPRLKRRDIQEKLNCGSQWDDVVKRLSKLFALFFIARKHNLAMKSTGHAPAEFCSKTDMCNACGDKIVAYERRARKMIQTQNVQADLNKELQSNSAVFELDKSKDLIGKHVSGEFILFLCANRIAKQFETASIPDIDSFRYRLAEKCKFQSLAWLRREVGAYLKSK